MADRRGNTFNSKTLIPKTSQATMSIILRQNLVERMLWLVKQLQLEAAYTQTPYEVMFHIATILDSKIES